MGPHADSSLLLHRPQEHSSRGSDCHVLHSVTKPRAPLGPQGEGEGVQVRDDGAGFEQEPPQRSPWAPWLTTWALVFPSMKEKAALGGRWYQERIPVP